MVINTIAQRVMHVTPMEKEINWCIE